MSFFKNLGDKATSTAKNIGNKSSDLVETGKLKMQISQIEGDIKKGKAEIGELIYSAYAAGLDLPHDQVLISCANLKAKDNEINDLYAKIEEVQND